MIELKNDGVEIKKKKKRAYPVLIEQWKAY